MAGATPVFDGLGDRQIGHEAEPVHPFATGPRIFHHSEESSSFRVRDVWVRRDAPARALSASAPRTNLRGAPGGPADPNGLRGVRLRGPMDQGHRDASTPTPEDARRERRESPSCWVSPASLSSRQGITPCEWAELPRELSTVSHSGQAGAQRGQEVLEASDIERSHPRERFADAIERHQGRSRRETEQPRGPHQDTKSTDSAVLRAIVSGVSVTPTRRELGLRKSVWCSRRTLD
jgi:hypothetical protein